MRKVVLAGVLAVAALAALPERSHAWGKDRYSSHGYCWGYSLAFRNMQWIHQAPLYSYGPYYGPGYVNMHIPKPYHGSYTPADPNLWNGGFGVYGSALPAPAAGYAPHATPTIPAQPYISQAPVAPGYLSQRVVNAAHESVYPAWVTGR
jgi:hypothetical protein